jgi:hypothetical protein
MHKPAIIHRELLLSDHKAVQVGRVGQLFFDALYGLMGTLKFWQMKSPVTVLMSQILWHNPEKKELGHLNSGIYFFLKLDNV